MDFPAHKPVPLPAIMAMISAVREYVARGEIFTEEDAEDLLEDQGVDMYDFYWSTLRLFKDKNLHWLDLAYLQNELEPYGHPVLKNFRRKVETHGLDLLIPNYDQLTKRKV